MPNAAHASLYKILYIYAHLYVCLVFVYSGATNFQLTFLCALGIALSRLASLPKEKPFFKIAATDKRKFVFKNMFITRKILWIVVEVAATVGIESQPPRRHIDAQHRLAWCVSRSCSGSCGGHLVVPELARRLISIASAARCDTGDDQRNRSQM